MQGFGLGFIFVPASTVAFATIPKHLSAEAAGLYSLVRSVGSAVGISLVSSYFVRSTQAHWELFRGQFSPYRGQVTDYLAGMHLAPGSPMGAQMLSQVLGHQAQLAAFVDTFWLVAASFVVMLPVLLFMRKTKPGGPAPAAPE